MNFGMGGAKQKSDGRHKPAAEFTLGEIAVLSMLTLCACIGLVYLGSMVVLHHL
jgi:hypothetical protein